MQGQDVLTCPTSTNNHQKTSICEVFLLEMMRDRSTIKLVTSEILYHCQSDFYEQAGKPVHKNGAISQI